MLWKRKNKPEDVQKTKALKRLGKAFSEGLVERVLALKEPEASWSEYANYILMEYYKSGKSEEYLERRVIEEESKNLRLVVVNRDSSPEEREAALSQLAANEQRVGQILGKAVTEKSERILKEIASTIARTNQMLDAPDLASENYVRALEEMARQSAAMSRETNSTLTQKSSPSLSEALTHINDVRDKKLDKMFREPLLPSLAVPEMEEVAPPAVDRIVIRAAAPEDALFIAHVHVLSWLESYTGVLEDDFIKARTPQKRLGQWERTLADPSICVFVAVVDGHLVGFASGSPIDHPDFEGELSTCYLLKDHHGKGLGFRLVCHVVQELKRRGLSNLRLTVLANNPYRTFYERMCCERVIGEEDTYGEREVWTYRLPAELPSQ